MFEHISIPLAQEYLLKNQESQEKKGEKISKEQELKNIPEEQVIGKSRGGLSTKIHASCDEKGRPRRFFLTARQRSDYIQAMDLLENEEAQAVLADKGYDSNAIVDLVQAMNAAVVVPGRKHRKEQREIDEGLYKQRNIIERMFNRFKGWRRIATRYDKTASSFLGFLQLAAALIWVK